RCGTDDHRRVRDRRRARRVRRARPPRRACEDPGRAGWADGSRRGHRVTTLPLMARQNELVAHLAEVPLFSHCSKRDLQEVARGTEVIEVPEGARIVSQGDAGDAFFVLLEGSAVVKRNDNKVGELLAGDYFGELAVLDPAPRNADVIAQTPVTVGRL